MIIRVFEGRLKAGREQDFMIAERRLLARTDIDGLLGVSVGRRLSGDRTQVITLSVWRDRTCIERFAERDVDQPVFLTGADDFVDSWSLTHYDALDAVDPDEIWPGAEPAG